MTCFMRCALLLTISLAAIVSLPSNVQAHSLSLFVLQLDEQGDGDFAVHWQRVPGVLEPEAATLLLKPVYPDHCSLQPPRLRCGVQGLAGSIGFRGLTNLSGTGLIRVTFRNRPEQTLSFSSIQPELTISAAHEPAPFPLFLSFVEAGLEHILFGIDHLMFVLGLIWLVRSRLMLLKTVTAFTIAHSLTLGAAVLDLWRLPAAPVEAAIALSIALLAVELVKTTRHAQPGLTSRAPWLVAFGFGLLHGFGFATALGALQVGPNHVASALLGFNLGVELGQLAFVALLLALRPWLTRLLGRYVARASLSLHYALGTLAMYWFFERLSDVGVAVR